MDLQTRGSSTTRASGSSAGKTTSAGVSSVENRRLWISSRASLEEITVVIGYPELTVRSLRARRSLGSLIAINRRPFSTRNGTALCWTSTSWGMIFKTSGSTSDSENSTYSTLSRVERTCANSFSLMYPSETSTCPRLRSPVCCSRSPSSSCSPVILPCETRISPILRGGASPVLFSGECIIHCLHIRLPARPQTLRLNTLVK